jgi:hypothetical protein
MNKKQKIQLIESYISLLNSFEKEFDLFEKGLGCQLVECRLRDNIYKSLDQHLNNISKAIGDENDWVSWFIYDNDCGKSKLQAGLKDKMKQIKSVKDLVDLIEDVENPED